MQKIKSISGLKALSTIGITLFHYYIYLCNRDENVIPIKFAKFFWKNGDLYVALFFLISGFLLAFNYKEKIESYSLSLFLKRRFLKMYPSIIIITLISAILTAIEVHIVGGINEGPFSLYKLLLSLCMMSMGWVYNVYPYDGVLWYINVLFLVTIIWYIICCAKKINPSVYKPMCFIMVIVGLCCMKYNVDIPFLYFQNGQGYISFFIGVLLCDVYKEKGFRKNIVVVLFYTVVLFLVLGKLYGYKNILGNVTMTYYTFVSPVLFATSVTVIPIKKILESRILQYIGKISFPIYIIHERLYYIIFDLGIFYGHAIDYSNIFVWVGIMLIVIVLSIAWHICIEKRFSEFIFVKLDIDRYCF